MGTRLDYCNVSLYGASKNNISRLQHAHNKLTRVVTGTKKFDHINPMLQRLHCFPSSRGSNTKWQCWRSRFKKRVSQVTSRHAVQAKEISRTLRKSDEDTIAFSDVARATKSLFLHGGHSPSSLNLHRTIYNPTCAHHLRLSVAAFGKQFNFFYLNLLMGICYYRSLHNCAHDSCHRLQHMAHYKCVYTYLPRARDCFFFTRDTSYNHRLFIILKQRNAYSNG